MTLPRRLRSAAGLSLVQNFARVRRGTGCGGSTDLTTAAGRRRIGCGSVCGCEHQRDAHEDSGEKICNHAPYVGGSLDRLFRLHKGCGIVAGLGRLLFRDDPTS